MRKFKSPIPLTDKQKKIALSKLHKGWQATASQAKILKAIYRDGFKRIFIRAGRKFGKNEIANYLCWRTTIEEDMAESYIIGPTASDERKVIWENMRLQTFGPNFGFGVKDDNMLMRFPWGSLIQVDGSRNVEGGRGRQYHMNVLDEIKDQNPKYYDAAYPNLLSKNGVLVLIGTPPKEEEYEKYHYFEWEKEAINSPLWKYFKFTSWDNTMLPGGQTWLEQERARYVARGEEDIWLQEYEVKTVRSNRGIVFPMFSEDFHVRSQSVMLAELERPLKNGNVEFYTISDPGNSTFCVLFFAYNKETSQIYLLDEIYETNRYETSAIPMWKKTQRKKLELMPNLQLGAWEDIYDEAASWFEVEVLTRFGDKLRQTNKKAGQSIRDHVSLIKDAMRVPRCLNISRECYQTIKEIKGFRDLSQVDKNHALDCFRYFIEESGYQFQDTADTIIMPRRHIIEPRARTIEQDMREWEQEIDPYAAITDFGFEDIGDDFEEFFGM